MTSVKDTASFFANGSSNQFDFALGLYPQVLKLKAQNKCKKPEDLIRLDDWYQNKLPQLIKKRGKDRFVVHEELVQTMKWKQTRGKFFPQLSYLIKVNTPRAVQAETKKAFRKLPNLEQAITALSNLKGVGTTMASALLAAAAPETAPFMADECLMAIPEIEGIDYTTREYMNFVQHIQATTDRLNEEVHGPVSSSNADGSNDEDSNDAPKIEKKWSPHNVELALWTHYVARELQPELLDDMPAAVEGSKNSYTRNPTSTKTPSSMPAATNGASVSLASSENNTMEEPSDESNLETELGKATSDESSKDNKYMDSLDECTKSEDSLEKPSTTTASIRNNNSDEVNDSDSQSSAKRSMTYEEEEDDDEDEDDEGEDDDDEDDEESSVDGAPVAKKTKFE
ncbi:probable serine/threonine-protein kinase mps1 [Toxorhynchites rutilus septentrionalis]|uniref:probable serine/threonine-protein kinase mps1 n=1 Tax=Toxorhynchites rutilus septentrionalis TaxID=329112 RepID=UPI00247AE390|nr:probable serine/threonine-protein kinase mps1 [Toxorhynchites rutilus septentrionalis]XP_055640854.1 probable serine/threonine-protein kinase mps1 [Toxorhynchites rutilus septentrionalis]XP_055640855.1 probable serine/threonine-protein kinase mps1 [Toxorhynchites rutilus septentrionalis]XP_055640856.1 probable serine/threonine-protein kinase mps1 [Toxorhynchites rutilus septentrionalis]XP_055640857.1 probable serine/threonine-protein kinase mps1 [Toxorhynchites rutilus septentrionalis]XP_05